MRSVCILMILFLIGGSHAITVESIAGAFSITKVILHSLYDAYETFEEFSQKGVPTSPKEQKLYNKLNSITVSLEKIETSLPQTSISTIKELEASFSEIIHFEIKLDSLVENVNSIESTYETFLDLINKLGIKLSNSLESSGLERYTLKDFAKSVVSYEGDSVRNNLDHIHQMMVPRKGSPLSNTQKNIFSLIINHFQKNDRSHCLISQSPQQLLFNLFTSFRIVQLKGLLMTQFSYMILRLYGEGNFSTEIESFRSQIISRLNQQAESVKQVSKNTMNSMWKCDPENHILDETYTEITRLVQGYLHNEIDLNKDGSCRGDGCREYEVVNRPGCTNKKNALCNMQTTCKGRVLRCGYVSDDMSICMSKDRSRRYDWIDFSNGNKFGPTDNSCHDRKYVSTFREYIFWRCFYCFCYCDEESRNSDRYVSLLPAVSDAANNKLVVGVRFIKKDRVIHLQIKEGKLNSMGLIDNSTLSWVPLPSIDVESSNKSSFHTMKYESRAIDLDDLLGPRDTVVTGVRLRLIGAHLNLEVQMTSVNFKTGQLNTGISYWIGNDNTDAALENPRKQLKLSSKNTPLFNPSDYSTIDSVSDQYLEFESSDKYSDAGQSTVPFIDTQLVEPSPPMPLTGIGIAHKGSRSSAGFIMPKVFTYNMDDWLSPINPSEH